MFMSHSCNHYELQLDALQIVIHYELKLQPLQITDANTMSCCYNRYMLQSTKQCNSKPY